jgi:hypothetical protein
VRQSKGTIRTYYPDIKTGERTEGAQLIGITPTALHMTGLPVRQDMDSTVLKELFKEESAPAQMAVEYEGVSPERKRVTDRVARLKMSDKI